MLIDWITFKFDISDLPDGIDIAALLSLSDVVTRYNPVTGEEKYTTSAWDSIRSDTHGISYKASHTELVLMGSPARCWGSGSNVFGSTNILQCARLMVSMFYRATGILLPDPVKSHRWKITTIDITRNFDCGSLPNVRTALAYLRGCEGGRYRVSSVSGDTVYWNGKSKRRKAKAYSKGSHIRYQIKKGLLDKRLFSESQLQLLDRLLRLELRLGSNFFSDFYQNGLDWRIITHEWLAAQFADYFDKMIGSTDIGVDMSQDILENIRTAAVDMGFKNSMGDRAHCTFQMIKSMGWEHAREIISKPTWYRHLQILRHAGFTDLDISHGCVVPLRQSTIDLSPVDSLQALLDLAA